MRSKARREPKTRRPTAGTDPPRGCVKRNGSTPLASFTARRAVPRGDIGNTDTPPAGVRQFLLMTRHVVESPARTAPAFPGSRHGNGGAQVTREGGIPTMPSAYEILEEDDPDAVEKYGELTYTDNQMEVIRAATENREATPGELADMVSSSEGHVRNVLRRADVDDAMGTVEPPQEAEEATEEEQEAAQEAMDATEGQRAQQQAQAQQQAPQPPEQPPQQQPQPAPDGQPPQGQAPPGQAPQGQPAPQGQTRMIDLGTFEVPAEVTVRIPEDRIHEVIEASGFEIVPTQ